MTINIKKYHYPRKPIPWETFKNILKKTYKFEETKFIADWLVKNGYVKEEFIKNYKRLVPTQKGINNGFYLDNIEDSNGYFQKIMFVSIWAQKIVINNLNDMISSSKSNTFAPSQKKQKEIKKKINDYINKIDTSKNCKNCMDYKLGECIGTSDNSPCEDFKYSVVISQETKDSWPEEGYATTIRKRFGKK